MSVGSILKFVYSLFNVNEKPLLALRTLKLANIFHHSMQPKNCDFNSTKFTRLGITMFIPKSNYDTYNVLWIEICP